MNNNISEFKKFLREKGIKEEEYAQFFKKIENNYGLNWENKEEYVFNQLLENFPILKESKDKAILSNKEDNSNLLIEGDNLHSLKALQYTHKGLINVIYIDPPYNTGNKDFKYNDRFVDKEDTWRHSNWLSFMDKRLKLAKDLLTDDGIIFISIDDNEIAQLKLLCDSIFGENNFVANMIWKSKSGGANDTKHIVCETEYILTYSKNISKLIFNKKVISNKSDYKLKDKYKDTRGNYKLKNLDMGSLSYGKALDYPIEAPDGTLIYPGSNYEAYLERQSGNFSNKDWRWRWSKKKFEWGLLNGFIEFKKIKGIWKVYTKQYEFVDHNGKEIKRSVPYRNLIDFTNTANGLYEIKELFENKRTFSYPKPMDLMEYLINLIPNKNAIVLDFFAGSGTTGHVVLELNKKDGGNRKFILCTNNENNICEEVTYQRLNKAINGYTTPTGKKVEGLGGNLNYFKINLEEKHNFLLKDVKNLVNKCTGVISIKEDCYNLLENNSKYDIISNNNNKIILICKVNSLFNDDVENTAGELDKYNYKTKIIYTTKADVKIKGIITKEFPKEIIKLISQNKNS